MLTPRSRLLPVAAVVAFLLATLLAVPVEARPSDAQLSNARLSSARLSSARLSSARLSNARLSNARPAGALAVVARDSQHYYRTGYCSATGWGLGPAWAGNFPYWNAQCADNYRGGIDPRGRLVLADQVGNRVRVQTWDLDSHRRLSRRTMKIRGWTLHAFHVGPDGRYYAVLGRDNDAERDGYTTLAVRAYTPRLRRDGTARIHGRDATLGIGMPGWLRASTALANGILVVHMSRDLYGNGSFAHQANLTFAVDTATMQPYRLADTADATYVSHSLAQFVDASGDDAVFVDHGDGYPRAIALTVLHGFFDPAATVTQDRFKVATLLPQTRRASGQNFTGATVNGMAAGPSGVLTTGVSLPHTRKVKGVTGVKHLHAPNAYLAATDPTSGHTRWRWLTRYSPRSRTTIVGEPRIVEVAPDRFAILYHVEKHHRVDPDRDYTGRLRLFYRLVDSRGRVLATRSWPGRHFMPGSALYSADDALWWVAGHQTGRGDHYRTRDYLFGIDLTRPARPRLLRR